MSKILKNLALVLGIIVFGNYSNASQLNMNNQILGTYNNIFNIEQFSDDEQFPQNQTNTNSQFVQNPNQKPKYKIMIKGEQAFRNNKQKEPKKFLKTDQTCRFNQVHSNKKKK